MTTTVKQKTIQQSAAFIDRVLAQEVHDSPPWLHRIREAGKERARHLRIPSRKHEDWLYADLRPLAELQFAPTNTAHADADISAWQIDAAVAECVFINGEWMPSLSRLDALPDGLTVLPLADAVEAEADALKRVLTSTPPDKEHVFAALNKALWRTGVFIHATAGADIAAPIHILHLTTTETPIQTHPRTVILADEKSAVRVIETFASANENDSAYFTNAATDILVDPEAAVEYYTVNRESTKAFHLSDLRLTQAAGSFFHAARADVGGGFVRNHIDVEIRGEGIECDLNGVYVLNAEQVVDNFIFVHHQAPGAISRQLYKGVLDDRSRGIFAGKILVDPEAQQTNAYQTSRHLLLSDDAEANTRPMLEILADDVKCSHGATSGPVVAEELFYLESRGIPRDPATRLLSRGFIYDVLYRLKNEIARDHFDNALANRFAV